MLKHYLMALALVPTLSWAQLPNLIGTWTGESIATVMGGGGHHPGHADSGPAFKPIKVIYIIEKQEGRNFFGVFKSPTLTEPFIGTFRRDHRSGIMTDLDGQFNFDVYEKDRMEICYSHPKGSGGYAVAVCVDVKRQ